MATKNDNALKVTMPSDREVVLERTFNAPRRLVFEALSKPEHVKRWFGLRGSTMPVCEIDARPGGGYRYVLRGPDGSEFTMKGTYREIVAPERVVFTESYDLPGMGWTPESLVTTTLEERDGKTKVTSLIVYDSQASRDGHVNSGMERGAGETYDRLAELLATMV